MAESAKPVSRVSVSSRAAFRLAYEGPGVPGVMDVRDLGPVLVALGHVCEEANRALNADRAVVTVQARAEMREGSFDFALELVQQLVAHTPSLFAGPDVRDAQQLLLLLGFLGDAQRWRDIGTSVIKLLKWLQRKEVVERTVSGTNVIVKATDGSQVTVNVNVITLAEDAGVRGAIEGIVKPLERPGVDRLELKEPSGEVVDEVKAGDVPALRAPQPLALEQPLGDEVRETVLQIVKLSFDEHLEWMFSDGTGNFSAPIKDAVFWEQVHRQVHHFVEGDMLRVRLRIRQTRVDGRIKADPHVVEVLEVLHIPRQVPLLAVPAERRSRQSALPELLVAPAEPPKRRRLTRKRQRRGKGNKT